MVDVMDLILRPIRIGTSKKAQQSYINIILLSIASFVLLVVAASSYILFYFSFIPQIGIERTVHLQYGDGPNPYAFVALDSALTSQQSYVISTTISLPRSVPNLSAGNFMVSMSLLSPTYTPGQHDQISSFPDPGKANTQRAISKDAIIYSSRRSALLTYYPPIIALSIELAALPLYVLGWRRTAETLDIPMTDSRGVYFERGWKAVPKLVYIELQGRGQEIQVYSMSLKLRAKFSGLRWIMYNHRVISFVIFTGIFWIAECIAALLTWMLLSMRSSGSKLGGKVKGEVADADADAARIKNEDGAMEDEGLETDDLDLSDTPRSFPTYGRQAPLRYVPKVKDEPEDYDLEEPGIKGEMAEADDESEEPVDLGSFSKGGRSDSGLGTSFSEGGSVGSLLRRSRSGKGRG